MLRRFMDKTRRAVLIDIAKILQNEKDLKRYAGKNALIDCALLISAENDEELLQRLNRYIDTDELRKDIKHVNHSMQLKRKLMKEV